MPSLFPVTEVDTRVYEEELRDFLPDRMIDIHTHVWLNSFNSKVPEKVRRAVTWPSLVAAESPIEELLETYRLLFPGKQVTPLIFGSMKRGDDHEGHNRYVAESSAKHGVPSLLYAFPEWSAEELLLRIVRGRHLGIKVYLNLAPEYLPEKEIRIFDFIPRHQLELLNSRKMILMLHIPRDRRLGDPVNLAQMLEIEERYPDLNVIYAHIGRAYCPEDIGNAFELLRKTRKLVIDFSANTQEEAMYRALDALGPKRILFGSDLPILRMRMRRICEDGRYVNLVPKGLYGDVSSDPNMREVGEAEGRDMTFFMYEELRSFKKAAARVGLSRSDIEQVFHGNAQGLINRVGLGLYGTAIA